MQELTESLPQSLKTKIKDLDLWQSGFKVINRWTRTSAVMRQDFTIVHYGVLKLVKPQQDCGPLAVFANLEAAEYFCAQFINKILIIKRCLYKQSLNKTLYYHHKKYDYALSAVCIPSGTVFADYIICLD